MGGGGRGGGEGGISAGISTVGNCLWSRTRKWTLKKR